MKNKREKGKWYLIQGTTFFREYFYTDRKNLTAKWMARKRFGGSKEQDFTHTRIITHAEILKEEKDNE